MFQDMQQGKGPARHGWSKIEHFSARARDDSHEWAWIDTCRIEKASNSELS